jgi:hypothetical protein
VGGAEASYRRIILKTSQELACLFSLYFEWSRTSIGGQEPECPADRAPGEACGGSRGVLIGASLFSEDPGDLGLRERP